MSKAFNRSPNYCIDQEITIQHKDATLQHLCASLLFSGTWSFPQIRTLSWCKVWNQVQSKILGNISATAGFAVLQ